jgi:hypothetical protein
MAAARLTDRFGTGKPERSCVFMHFFLSFMKELQKELQGRQAPPQSMGS